MKQYIPNWKKWMIKNKKTVLKMRNCPMTRILYKVNKITAMTIMELYYNEYKGIYELCRLERREGKL